MRRSIAALCIGALLTACGPAALTTGLTPTAQPSHVTPAPKAPAAISVDQPQFTMTLPHGWEIHQDVWVQDVRRSKLLAVAPDGQVIVAVLTMPLDGPDGVGVPDEKFGLVAGFIAMKTEAEHVLLANSILADRDLPGTFLVMVTRDDDIVMQEATGYDGTGFVLRCGGAASRVDMIKTSCPSILKTFHVKRATKTPTQGI